MAQPVVRGLNQARRAWDRLANDIGDELRTARLLAGATQRQVGAAIGVSPSEISRRELGQSHHLTGARLAVHAAAVGLKLWVKLFPIGGGVRDEAQARYIAAFVALVGRSWRVTLEAVMPAPGDLRAADVLLVSGPLRIVVEVITRVSDIQAQIRAAQTKARDLGATRLILVIADTHANRRALNAVSATLMPGFTLDARRVFRALGAGNDPGRDALVLLRLRSRH
ncbi:MAG: helix-turn-helix domain-containing protein [Candidatus Limnocylindria bacterium]